LREVVKEERESEERERERWSPRWVNKHIVIWPIDPADS